MLLTSLVLLQCCGISAGATDTQSTDIIEAVSDTPSTEAAQTPTQSTQPPTEATQPPTQSTQPPEESTSPSTESTQPPADSTTPVTPPAVCSHTYGAWSSSETAHSRTCIKCGHAESTGHTWAAETVTVAPTCKEGGGTAKICTVCQLILIVEIKLPLTTHTYDNACDIECNVCALKRDVTHTYSAIWTKNAKGHWHACTVCGAQDEVKPHYPGPAATEEKEQLCLTCGYVMMQKRNHTHKLETLWSSDNYGHWHACSGCSEQKDYADHTYDDGCDADCNTCSFTRNVVHTYGTDWQRDEKTHGGVCTVCGEKGSMEDHILDAATASCSICGQPMEAEEAEHEHSFGSAWDYDEAGHWQVCSCSEQSTVSEHDWDDGRESEEDTITFTCKICGIQRQEQALEKGFPWMVVLAGIGFVIAVVGIVICLVMIRRNGKYSR